MCLPRLQLFRRIIPQTNSSRNNVEMHFAFMHVERISYRMTDTSPEANRLQIALYARMPASRRFGQAVARSASLRRMVWQRVVEAHPGADTKQLRKAFAERWLGPELAARVYGGGGD